MSGAKSRRKGHDFERAFCRDVREELGIEFARNLKQYGAAQEGDTDPLGPFLPECKNCARLNLPAWWRQAVVQAKKRDLIPLLIYKVPRKGWRAIRPNPIAWATGQAWRYDYEFTVESGPQSLWLDVREYLGGDK